MDAITVTSRGRIRRALLLALFATIAWCVLSLASTATPASAADESDSAGLLGAVGSLVDGVSGVIDDSAPIVDEALAPAVDTSTPVTETLSPVTEPVVDIVQQVDATVQHVDTRAGDVVDTVTETASDLADVGVATEVIDPAVEIVADVPIVGDVVDITDLDDALTGIARGVDSAITALVGTAPDTGSLVPPLTVIVFPTGDGTHSPVTPPLPVALGPSQLLVSATPAGTLPQKAINSTLALSSSSRDAASGLSSAMTRAAAPSGSGGDSVSRSGDPGHPVGSSPTFSPNGQLFVSGASGAGSGAAGEVGEQIRPSLPRLLAVHGHSDDAVPGAPVYDTDIAPD